MSNNTQSDKSMEVIPPIVTVNDLILDEMSNENLLDIKNQIQQASVEINKEIKNRHSQENVKARFDKDENEAFQIKIIKHLPSNLDEEIKFKEIFDKHQTIPRKIIESRWLVVIGALSPVLLFALASYITVRFSGGFNNQSITIIIAYTGIFVYLGWKVLSFFESSQKYNNRRKMIEYKKRHNLL